jgi:hypothetical protein
MGRRKAHIDLAEMEKLYSLQCTDVEVAAFFGISTRTIERRRQVRKFRETIDRAKAKGRVSVRRNLFRLASNGNIAAAIFLAKNLLGYRDVGSIEHSGPAGGPIQLAAKPNLSQLTDDELQQLRVFALKTLPGAGDRPGTGDAKPS